MTHFVAWSHLKLFEAVCEWKTCVAFPQSPMQNPMQMSHFLATEATCLSRI